MGTKIAYNECKAATLATADINRYIEQIVEAVDRAYRYTCLNPWLGAYATLDGHTEHWVEVWTAYRSKTGIHLPAAAFGYAIESIATLMYLPDPPRGMAVVLQGQRGPTRPDIILIQDGNDVAWIDITASASSGHIWKKVGWKGHVNHCAEVVYDSIDIAALNTDPLAAPDDVDENEARERIQFAKWLHRERQEKWRQRGKELFREETPIRGDPSVRDEQRRKQAIGVLAGYFGDEVPRDELANAAHHVLHALDIDPTKWGFITGFGMSRSEGESFLLRYDPNLLTLEMQKLSIPRPLALSPFETPPWKVPVREDALVPRSRTDARLGMILHQSKKVHKPRIRLPKLTPSLANLLFTGPESLFDFPDRIRRITVLTRRKNTPYVRRFVGRRTPSTTSGPQLTLPSSLSKLGLGLSWNSDVFPLLQCLTVGDRSEPPTTTEPGDLVVGIGVQWDDHAEVVMMDEEVRAQLMEKPELLAIEDASNQ